MTRGRAAVLAIVVALTALTLLALTSLDQATARAARADVTAAAAPIDPPPPRPATRLCITGPGGAATAAATAHPPVLADHRIDPTILAAVSALAFSLERTIERHGATIPQRAGLDAVTPAEICQPLTTPAEATSPPR